MYLMHCYHKLPWKHTKQKQGGETTGKNHDKIMYTNGCFIDYLSFMK